MAEPLSVLYAVCLEHTCDGRKVDLGLNCWRWGRADDDELTFWELRRFVHALFHWEQKHVLPSRWIKRLRTEWAKLFCGLWWFWGDEPVLKCNRGCHQDSCEGRVRCADEVRSCNSGTVGRAVPQEESACHSADHALLLSEMLLHGRECRMSPFCQA